MKKEKKGFFGNFKVSMPSIGKVQPEKVSKLSSKQIEKENIVVTSIRYETRFFELGLPFTLYNDNDLRLGLWVRIGPIIIGSDNFAPIFIEQNQLSGADIYFAIRINNLNTNLKNNKNRSQKERCYW